MALLVRHTGICQLLIVVGLWALVARFANVRWTFVGTITQDRRGNHERSCIGWEHRLAHQNER